jgi:hypothetical protein
VEGGGSGGFRRGWQYGPNEGRVAVSRGVNLLHAIDLDLLSAIQLLHAIHFLLAIHLRLLTVNLAPAHHPIYAMLSARHRCAWASLPPDCVGGGGLEVVYA